MSRLIRIIFCFLISSHILAQTTLRLDNMEAFRPQAGNWQIVGDVVIDRNIDIHDKHESPTEPSKKKRRKEPPPPEPPKAVSYSAGTGILLNDNDDATKDHLFTVLEHGDIKLELDVMIPRGSNSGITYRG